MRTPTSTLGLLGASWVWLAAAGCAQPSSAALARARADGAQAGRQRPADEASHRVAAQREEICADASTGAVRRGHERGRPAEEELRGLHATRTDRGTVLTIGDRRFETDRAALKPAAMPDLDRIAGALRHDPDREVTIEGYTDDTGPVEYNRRLSEARADAVRDRLIGDGVAADRIVARGLGESMPIASNATESGRRENRRVEIILPPEPAATAGSGRQ
jgi:outer membrane protein OmpA-like peptidoglycan-associated protein